MLDIELVNIHDNNTYIFRKTKDAKKKDNISYTRYKDGKLYSKGSMSIEEFNKLILFCTFRKLNGK